MLKGGRSNYYKGWRRNRKEKGGTETHKKNQSQGPEKGVKNDTDRALHLLGLPSAQTELALNSGGFLGMPTRS
jgi:hypothetical protein